ncbi:MAG: HlyD family type I secretion periplasmic adaptor subunit [Betaproteobacteria bacterium]|nr:HlyD family type I secretion periplasmic adaptor subunit [Betaproteobacteria bacterium]
MTSSRFGRVKGSAQTSKAKSSADRKTGDLEFLPDPDAIEQRSLAGMTRALLVLLSGLLAGAVLWASLSEIDEVITAPGKLVSAFPNLTVQPLETAIIRQIHVKAGQIVKKGDPLASLDPTFAAADQSQIKGLIERYDARAERIRAELTTLGKGFSMASEYIMESNSRAGLQQELRVARAANYQARIIALSENIARLEVSLKSTLQNAQILSERLKAVAEVESMQEQLVAQNFGAKRQLLEARERRLEIEREIALSSNREQEILREIAVQRSEQSAFRNEWRQRLLEDLTEVEKERNNLSSQLSKVDMRRSLVSLLAPADAVVLEIPQRSLGSVVPPAEVMFSLVPIDTPLEAELKIAARDVGFVKVGDPVKIKLDAFPFQKFGILKGKVLTVSEDAFTKDPDGTQALRQIGSYYVARIRLESLKLERRSHEALIRPGSSLTGEILIGKRTVMSYFIYPLVGTLDESLRERR